MLPTFPIFLAALASLFPTARAGDHAVQAAASSGAVNASTTLQTSLAGSELSFHYHKRHLVPRQPSATTSTPASSSHARNDTVDELQDLAAYLRQRFQDVVKQNSTHFYHSNITDGESIDQVIDDFEGRFSWTKNDLKNVLLPDIESKYQNASNAYWVRSAPVTSRGKKLPPGAIRKINLPRHRAPNVKDCPDDVMVLSPLDSDLPLFMVDYYIPPSLFLMFALSIDPSEFEFSDQAWISATNFQSQVGWQDGILENENLQQLRKELNGLNNLVGVDGEIYLLKRIAMEASPGEMPWHDVYLDRRQAFRSYLKQTRSRFIENAAKLGSIVNKAYPVTGQPREERLGGLFEEVALAHFAVVYEELDESIKAVERGIMRAPDASGASGILDQLGSDFNASGTDPPIRKLIPLSIRDYLEKVWGWDAYTTPHALTMLASMNVNFLSRVLLKGWSRDQTPAKDVLSFVRTLTNYGYPSNGTTVMTNNIKAGLTMRKAGIPVVPD